MTYFDVLSEVLATKVASGAIGDPVALRLYLQLSGDHGLIVPYSAVGALLAERCFSAPADILHVQGAVISGYLSLLAECGGRTAMIHSELIGPKTPEAYVRLLLVGSNGSLGFEDSPLGLGRASDLAPPSWPALGKTIRNIQRLLPPRAGRG